MCIVIFSNPLYVPPLHVGHKSLLVGTRNLNLITKTNREGGAEQSKVTCNNLLLLYSFKVYNTLAYFSVNGKPHNLYLVQLYQNTGDYPTDNIAAVTVSLHQPVYAMVYVNIKTPCLFYISITRSCIERMKFCNPSTCRTSRNA